MNKLLASAAFVSALLTPLALYAATKPEVTRIKGDPKSPILSGVIVPAQAQTLYLSGQVPLPLEPSKPGTTLADYGDTKTQAVSVFKKIDALLKAQGLGLGDVVKLTVFLVGDPKLEGKLDFKGFSEAYAQFFGTTEQPNLVARSTVQVAALASPAFLVEIEATAVFPPKGK
jgi:enamine deaminase RidA (YjgF/YER057c/UK114 family)